MASGRDDLIESFWRRAPERVAELTDRWLAIENGGLGDLPALRRTLHTFKGEAHMLGLEGAGTLLERCEKVVDVVRETNASPKIAGDALLSGFEALGLLAGAVGSSEELELGEVFAALDAAFEQITGGQEAEGDEVVPGEPVLESAPKKAPPARPSADAEPSSKRADGPPPESRTTPTKDIPAEVKEAGAERARQEMALEVTRVSPLFHELRRLHAEHALLLPELAEIERQVRALLVEVKPDVSAELLRERIVKTLGYGTEIERRLSALREMWSANEFATNLALERMSDVVTRASLVSTDELVAQVHRVARSTARTLGKEVSVRISGDALVDAAVEKRLRPALLHLVRNAVDHGIEPAAVRKKRRKPERGTISISLSQAESSVTAIVEDDGGGIDFEALRRKLAAGTEVSDASLLDRIFEHGVSTRDVADEISGRGVGLDVVLKELSEIGGTVAVEATSEHGTRFALTMPVTLKADVVVPIVHAAQSYAVAARTVYGIRRAGEIVETAHGLHIRVTDGNEGLVPVTSLASLLAGRGRPRPDDVAIVLRHRTGLFALTVDGVQNPRPVTFQRTNELAFRSPMVRGVAVLADGGTMQLLDVESLHDVAARRGDVRATAEQASEAHALVVEDAPVARELLVGLLRSFGLRVTEAVDGRDGLQKALADRPDLVLSDLEMPYLDGLALIARLRQEPSTARVPVIVLTTRADPETEARAMALGVSAFLSKQRFVEDRLREVVESCLSKR